MVHLTPDLAYLALSSDGSELRRVTRRYLITSEAVSRADSEVRPAAVAPPSLCTVRQSARARMGPGVKYVCQCARALPAAPDQVPRVLSVTAPCPCWCVLLVYCLCT